MYEPCDPGGIDVSYVFGEVDPGKAAKEPTGAVADDSVVKEVHEAAAPPAEEPVSLLTHIRVTATSEPCQAERVAVHLRDGDRNPLATVSTTLSDETAEIALDPPPEIEPGESIQFTLDHLVSDDSFEEVSVDFGG